MSGRAASSATKEEILAAIVDQEEGVAGILYSGMVMSSAPIDGVSEIQILTITGTPGGGTFTVTYNGVTSGNIAYNAAAATVQAALEAMSSIGTGNVTVSGGAGGPYTVTFAGSLAGMPIGAVEVAHAFTGGSSPDIESEVDTVGVTGSFRAVAGLGALLNRTDTPGAYINKGTSVYKPAWKLITTAA